MPRKAREIPWLDVRKGIYYVFWFNREAGRTDRMSLRVQEGDTEAAQAAYVTFLSQGRGMYENRCSDLSVARILDDYELEHINLKSADKLRHVAPFKHLKAFFGGALVRAIDIPLCRAYADARRSGEIGGGSRCYDRRAQDATIRRELGVLSAAANHAIKWKRLSPADKPSIERPQERNRETPWYTRPELDYLLATATGDLKDFMTLLYWTGARSGAIQKLREEQVNLHSDRINLLTPGKQQTAKRMPIVPIYDQIRDILLTRLKGARGGSLFWRSPSWYAEHYRDLCDGAGLNHKGHPHVMRHTRVTHLLQDGVNIYDVARLTGDTVSTIERVYGHHSSEYLKATTGS